MAKILLDYDQYKKETRGKEELIFEINNLIENEKFLTVGKKRLEKSNAELLLKLHDRNDEIEGLKKNLKLYEFANNACANENNEFRNKIDELKNKLKEIEEYNLTLRTYRTELHKIKSKWYVKLFYREKKIKVEPGVVTKTIILGERMNEPKNQNSHLLKPIESYNADDNKLGEIKNQTMLKKLKIKKITWKDRDPGYIDGYVSEIEKSLFHIILPPGNQKNYGLYHELHNSDHMTYLFYGDLIQAQESAQAILRKYIFRFLEG